MFRDLSGDHDERRRVHVGVRNTRHCICGARTRSDKHNSDASSRSRIALSHVHSALLMADEIVRDALPGAPKLIVNVEHSSTRIAKYRIDALKAQGFNQDLGASWQRLLKVFLI